jgi:hypothetical protein
MTEKWVRPAAGCNGGRGADGNRVDGQPQRNTEGKSNKPARLRVKGSGPSGEFSVSGQTARALLALVDAAGRGVTALELSAWALRLAAYVHSLRRLGLAITLLREPHPGGWHGRYVLASPVQLLSICSGEGGAQ